MAILGESSGESCRSPGGLYDSYWHEAPVRGAAPIWSLLEVTETFPGAIAEGNYEFDGDKVTVTDRRLKLATPQR